LLPLSADVQRRLENVAKTKLGLLGEIVPDFDNEVVMLRGTPQQVKQLVKLAELLRGAQDQRTQQIIENVEREAKRVESAARTRELLAKEQEARTLATEAERRKQLREEIARTQVEM
jgi:hypothetical protein